MKRLVALGASVWLVACGDGGSGAGATASTAGFCAEAMAAVDAFLAKAAAEHPTPDDPRYGGTVVVGTQVELTGGLGPTAADYLGTQYQQFVSMMTLVAYDATLTPRPYLARSWEVNEDTTSITFHLRDDVVWHDGERTDAHDVAFTYALVTDPAARYPNAGSFDLYDTADGMEVVDDFTVRVALRPHADYLDPWRALAIMPEHLLGGVPPDEIASHPFGSQCAVGNGPFVFREHRLQDRWLFTANPAFPRELGGRPYLDGIVHRVIPDQTTLLTELLTGGVDVLVDARPDQVEQIRSAGLEVVHFPDRRFVYVAWNARRPQLSDPRVRRALTMATNRHELVEASLLGYGSVANTTVPPFHRAHDPSVVPGVRYDPQGARRLLEEAGWVDRDGDGVRENAEGLPLGIELKYNTGNQQRQDIAEVMQAQLAEVGVAVRATVVEPSALQAQVFGPERREFDGLVFGFVSDFRVDDRDLFHSDRIEQPFALTGTRNPELDRLMDTLAVIVDAKAAKPLWDEYQRLLDREHPNTFLYFPDKIDAFGARMRGVSMDVRGEWAAVREWWIEPSLR